TREAFVLARDRHRRGLTKRVDEGLDVSSLVARRSIEMLRHADDDRVEPVFLTREPCDFLDDAIDGLAAARDPNRRERPRERAGWIADGKADAPAADVDP